MEGQSLSQMGSSPTTTGMKVSPSSLEGAVWLGARSPLNGFPVAGVSAVLGNTLKRLKSGILKSHRQRLPGWDDATFKEEKASSLAG